MSWNLTLGRLSDAIYGDDEKRVSSFEKVIDTSSKKQRCDHLLSLGIRLIQDTEEGIKTSNPAATQHLVSVLKNSDPDLLEDVPCDYHRFYSTHAMAEVILAFGDLSMDDPEGALKVYEKMHSLKHPEDCHHFEMTAKKESKAYHAIDAKETESLYAKGDHIAVLQKIRLDSEEFNTLYGKDKEKLSTLISQLERANQFKLAFECHQCLDTNEIQKYSKAIQYAKQALLNANYEEATFFLNIILKIHFPRCDIGCLLDFFKPFIKTLETCASKEAQAKMLHLLLKNPHSRYALLKILISLPNLQSILFQDPALREKILSEDLPQVINQIKGYLRDQIHTLSDADISKWFHPLMKLLIQHDETGSIAFLKQAIESLKSFSYQLSKDRRWLKITSYLYTQLLELTPNDPHVLFCLGMYKRFALHGFRDTLAPLIRAYQLAEGNTRGLYLAAVGDLLSDAVVSGIPLTKQEKELLERSKIITAVYALPDYSEGDFFEPISDPSEPNISEKEASHEKTLSRKTEDTFNASIPSQSDARFAIWETYKRIQNNNQLPNVYGDYGL